MYNRLWSSAVSFSVSSTYLLSYLSYYHHIYYHLLSFIINLSILYAYTQNNDWCHISKSILNKCVWGKGRKCLFGPKGKLDNYQLWRCIYFLLFLCFSSEVMTIWFCAAVAQANGQLWLQEHKFRAWMKII